MGLDEKGKIATGSPDVEIGGKLAARKGDLTDHAGTITTGCATVVINGEALLAARATDELECEATTSLGTPHVGGFITSGCATVLVGSSPAARVDDETTCLGPPDDDAGAVAQKVGGGSARAAETECQKLWRKYDAEARAIIAPAGDDHRQRNKIISAAYADLYLKNPELAWAGLAAYASKQVGCAMDYARALADDSPELDPDRGGSARAPGEAGRRMGQKSLNEYGPRVAATSAALTYDSLGIGNRDLFLDIYPMHRFFQEQGFARFAKCAAERVPPVTPQAMDGFRAIDRYKRTHDPKDLQQSVKSLAYHEQIDVLQRDIYNDTRMKLLLWANEKWDGHKAPMTMPAAVVLGSGCSDPGGKNTLVFGIKGRKNIFDVSERMDWILHDIGGRYFNEILGTQKHKDDLEQIRREGQKAGGHFP